MCKKNTSSTQTVVFKVHDDTRCPSYGTGVSIPEKVIDDGHS